MPRMSRARRNTPVQPHTGRICLLLVGRASYASRSVQGKRSRLERPSGCLWFLPKVRRLHAAYHARAPTPQLGLAKSPVFRRKASVTSPRSPHRRRPINMRTAHASPLRVHETPARELAALTGGGAFGPGGAEGEAVQSGKAQSYFCKDASRLNCQLVKPPPSRPGRSTVTVTIDTYAHVVLSMRQGAARVIAAIVPGQPPSV